MPAAAAEIHAGDMGTARHGDIDIAYEVEGAPGGEPLLLIMGLGLQMVFWPDGFRRLLAEGPENSGSV